MIGPRAARCRSCRSRADPRPRRSGRARPPAPWRFPHRRPGRTTCRTGRRSPRWAAAALPCAGATAHRLTKLSPSPPRRCCRRLELAHGAPPVLSASAWHTGPGFSRRLTFVRPGAETDRQKTPDFRRRVPGRFACLGGGRWQRLNVRKGADPTRPRFLAKLGAIFFFFFF